MKCKLGLSVIAFLTLSLNAQNLSDCFGDTVCNDNFHFNGQVVVLDKNTYTTNGWIEFDNSTLNLTNEATLIIEHIDGIHAGSENFTINGGNLITRVLEGKDFTIINNNLTIRTILPPGAQGSASFIYNITMKDSTLKINLSDKNKTYIQLFDGAFFENVYIYNDKNGIFNHSDSYTFTFHNGDFKFINSKLENISFDRHTTNSPFGNFFIISSKLKNVVFGVKQSNVLLRHLLIDNSLIDNSNLKAFLTKPSIKVANLTIKNIDGINSYINANIEVTNSTDASLQGDNAGNLTIQNSVIDKRANIKANKYTLIDSDFTGDIKAKSLKSTNSKIKGSVMVDTLNATNTTFYIYGGGVNTSFYDSYSGAIIVKDKAIGSGNIIHLANTDLSKLTGNLVPIALVDTKDVAITSTQTANASKATGGV